MSMIIAIALAMAAPTKAELKLLVPVKDTPVVQLDRNGAYVLLRSTSPVPLNLFRIAEPDEVIDYRARRAEALARAQRKWVKAHAVWVDSSEQRRKGIPNSPSPGDEPVRSTDENLDFPPIDQENLIGFGPLFRFAKEKGGASTYLQRVWPGRYVVYGSVLNNPNGGATGVCACMGTMSFEVKAGEIVDAGQVKVLNFDPITAPRMIAKLSAEESRGMLTGERTMIQWTPFDSTMSVDPRLSVYEIDPAQFRAAGPIPNYFGVQVDRMTAVPGVLGYDRGRIVDLARPPAATVTAAPSGP